MRTVYVYFSKVMDVKRFVESISSLEGQFDLIDGKYIVDARSLMGIFGMDLTKPIQLCIEKDSDKAMEAIQSFVVDEPIAAPHVADGLGTTQSVVKPQMVLEEV